LSQFTRLTDGRTDRILIARPRLHSMQRGKKLYTFAHPEESPPLAVLSIPPANAEST